MSCSRYTLIANVGIEIHLWYTGKMHSVQDLLNVIIGFNNKVYIQSLNVIVTQPLGPQQENCTRVTT